MENVKFIDLTKLDKEQLAKALVLRMQEIGVNKKVDLAEKSNVSLSIVKNLLSSKSIPNGIDLIKILTTLGLVPYQNFASFNTSINKEIELNSTQTGGFMNKNTMKAIEKAEQRLNLYESLNPQSKIDISRYLLIHAIYQLYELQPEVDVSDYLVEMAIKAIKNELKTA